MSAAEIQQLPMTKAEARRAVDQIKGHMNEARRLIYDLHQREGWKSLGYDSWSECVQAEFEESRAHLYQQLHAAQIEILLSSTEDKEPLIGSIPERQLRPLATLRDQPDQLREAWSLANEETGGKPTARAVAAAVDRVIGQRDPLPGQGDLFDGDEGNDPPPEIGREIKTAKVPTFNQTNEMVDWARWTWNPVTGCEHTCVYCYARDIANRFYPEKFTPTYRPERLDAPRHTHRPKVSEDNPVEQTAWRNVFVCSMADLFGRWVPQEWIDGVFESCRKSPEWNYLFLTKFPNRYESLDLPLTAWVGTSVDEQKRVANAEKSFRKIKAPVKWLSVEPMRERLRFSRLDLFDWVVIGGQSRSSGAPEFFPPFDWAADLWHEAKAAGCAVYFKPNTWPGAAGWLPKEYPKAMFEEPPR